ncbi:MAG: 5'-methylthioadenosine/S-adenosylhomocysteine nucleosidase [Clostridia bacterium]|nr:5'-methylthioadenosine/S-adenosylhomocysteine nucleosidase [Clostridia bacterium]MBQ7289207.1 5'-methylthioadenosine/S-adenosylhomocysteine nucleosidase [Clostridia bacterium]
MEKTLKIGLVIADDAEFAPVSAYCQDKGGKAIRILNRPAVRYILSGEERKMEIIAVYCGIGKVNAATLSTYLCAVENVNLMVNCGLSGGLSGVCVGEIVVGTGFVEHDFDLTAIGYAPGEKPGQVSFYEPDVRLTKDFQTKYPCKAGVMVSGDSFVSDSRKAETLVRRWNAFCCDMETAAIASVCHDFSVPYISIRRISDGADDQAAKTYQTSVMDKQTWMTLSVKWIESLLNSWEV